MTGKNGNGGFRSSTHPTLAYLLTFISGGYFYTTINFTLTPIIPQIVFPPPAKNFAE
jgi:hypothetical protein